MPLWLDMPWSTGTGTRQRGVAGSRGQDAQKPAMDCSSAAMRAPHDSAGCTLFGADGSMPRRRADGSGRRKRPVSRVKGGAAGMLLLALAVAQVPVGVGVMQSAGPMRREPCELVLASWNSAKLQELREVSRILHLRVSTAADHGIAHGPQQVPGSRVTQFRVCPPTQTDAQAPDLIVTVLVCKPLDALPTGRFPLGPPLPRRSVAGPESFPRGGGLARRGRRWRWMRRRRRGR